ncbi:hypothetical protein Syun_007636 [Stephania yunnanensis]|uniref:Reverse transcriptase zinc-binding domain-containing protein n=1 Tax=Stephania yunnanensis TaxID=152371 RepID=A0AAP0L1F5_9MAGN
MERTRSFAEDFSSLFSLSRNPEASVAEVASFVGGSEWDHSWHYDFRRRLGETEAIEFAALTHRLQDVSLTPHMEDKRGWGWDPSKFFSVKSFFYGLCLENSLATFPVYNLIWKSVTSMKVRVFVWMAWLGKINTTDVLQRRLPHITLLPSRCCLCFSHMESIDHLFLTCSFSCRLWEELSREIGIEWQNPQSLRTWMEQAAAISCDNKRNLLFKAGLLALLWALWGERNQRIFKEIDNTWQEIWESTKRNVGLALHGHNEFVGWSWQQWHGNWSDFC